MRWVNAILVVAIVIVSGMLIARKAGSDVPTSRSGAGRAEIARARGASLFDFAPPTEEERVPSPTGRGATAARTPPGTIGSSPAIPTFDGSAPSSGVDVGAILDMLELPDGTGSEPTLLTADEMAEMSAPSAAPKGSVVDISFRKLASFDYPQTPLGESGLDRIPASIRALHGRRVAVNGYMVPWTFDQGKIRTFFLSRQLFDCCFGDVAKVNEVIEVNFADGVANLSFRPITVVGTLAVGEVVDSFGYVMSVYRIRGESVIAQ